VSRIAKDILAKGAHGVQGHIVIDSNPERMRTGTRAELATLYPVLALIEADTHNINIKRLRLRASIRFDHMVGIRRDTSLFLGRGLIYCCPSEKIDSDRTAASETAKGQKEQMVLHTSSVVDYQSDFTGTNPNLFLYFVNTIFKTIFLYASL
jgi:hypothetical protein